jgi:crossover junction endodeoxyribonuclease RusA
MPESRSELRRIAATAGKAAPEFDVIAQFTIEGEPVSKERPRFANRHAYTPEKTAKAEEVVGWQFRRAAPRHKPGPGSYGVTAVFFCGSKTGRDVDNMLKLVLDGLNKVAWADDVQVTEVSARKVAAAPATARTEVSVYLAGLDGAA